MFSTFRQQTDSESEKPQSLDLASTQTEFGFDLPTFIDMTNSIDEPQQPSESQYFYQIVTPWVLAFTGITVACVVLAFQHEDDGKRRIHSRGGQLVKMLALSYIDVAGSLLTQFYLQTTGKPQWIGLATLVVATMSTGLLAIGCCEP